MKFSRSEHWSRLPFPSPRDLPNLGIKPRSPTLQAYSLPAESPGKPKNTGVGCHSLLQGSFPIQGSNPGLLRCRHILYQLSHRGSPWSPKMLLKSVALCLLPGWPWISDLTSLHSDCLDYLSIGNYNPQPYKSHKLLWDSDKTMYLKVLCS